ncbi:pyruvate formate lyase family protein [uncultured Oscillibacter sp.]|uniref:pyruvate formate lyase family protein n=1 Tax=uncultured Oscillibacter sp. TaxID=876091 RepID=UPI00262852C9|nr:pyruvate formate lyase family protein [uncultured Oscillibacter sp.]
MDRRARIKDRLFHKEYLTKQEWWGDEETILVSDEVKRLPLIVRKALAIKHVAEHMPLEIKPDELIVGTPTMASVGFGKCFPEYALPEELAEGAKWGFTPKSVFGHHLLNYETVLRKGLRGVREDVMRKLAEWKGSGGDREKTEFYRSILISLDALRALAVRYTDMLLAAAAEEGDVSRREELLQMAGICSRVPENPPETLQEAAQAVWFVFMLCHSTMEFIPVGRTDQYLYPFYQKDMESGRITKREAEEIIVSFLAKFSERVHMNMSDWEMHMQDEDTQYNGRDPNFTTTAGTYSNDESYNFGTSANHWLCNMILGGVTPEGEDAVNELSYIILEQWAYLEAVVPVMSVRLNRKTPEKFYRLCADILRNGASEPALYNDEIFIEGLRKAGISERDANDYSNDGCWEVLIPGRTNFGFCMLQVLQLLEYMLQGGRSLVRGGIELPGIPPLAAWDTFDSFYAYFLKLLEDAAVREIRTRLLTIKHRAAIAPSPLLSAFMDDCVERGEEYSVGGARYHVFGTYLTGFANCVDSLAAIKKLVYEDGTYTLEQVAEATRTNFDGKEQMRQYMMNRVPKFGNDDGYVDGIAVRLLDDFTAIIERLRATEAKGLILGEGIATFEFFAKWGHDVGASADGRKSQEPVASNFSPVHGADALGPTAAIRSVTAGNMQPYMMGAPLDMEIDPEDVKGEQGLNRMVALIKGFKEHGGLILTITGTNREKLLAAQQDPERYRNLRVRMGGLSAYFVTLSKEMQNSIIKRTSHSL